MGTLLLLILIIAIAADAYMRYVRYSDDRLDRLQDAIRARHIQQVVRQLQQLTYDAIVEMVNEVKLGDVGRRDSPSGANRKKTSPGTEL